MEWWAIGLAVGSSVLFAALVDRRRLGLEVVIAVWLALYLLLGAVLVLAWCCPLGEWWWQ